MSKPLAGEYNEICILQDPFTGANLGEFVQHSSLSLLLHFLFHIFFITNAKYQVKLFIDCGANENI